MMDGIDAIRQNEERTAAAGAADIFKSAAFGFDALLQITGKNGPTKNALKAAESESEFLRLDDNRDLVRDSHTLNDSESNREDTDNLDDVEEPYEDRETERADDNSDDQEQNNDTSETSEDSSGKSENEGTDEQNAIDSGDNNNGQTDVASNTIAAAVESALTEASIVGEKTSSETSGPQNVEDKTVQVSASLENDTGKTGSDAEQLIQTAVGQATAVQAKSSRTTTTSVETQATQTTANAAQVQTKNSQQANTPADQVQTQKGPEVRQDGGLSANSELRSASEKIQSQDLSKQASDNIDTRGQADQSDRAPAPLKTLSVQRTAAAAQKQGNSLQQSNVQSTQTQTQQAPEARQERGPAQNVEVRSAAAQAQSQDLSRRLGDNVRAQVQVNVSGPQTKQGPVEPGQFNRFVGYSPAETRTVSTANGQAGLGTATNATVAAATNATTVVASESPAEKPATQTTAPVASSASQPQTQATQPGPSSNNLLSRAEASPVLPRSGGESTSQSNTGQSGSSGSNTTTTTAPQTTAQASTTPSSQSFAQQVQQTAGGERPPAPTSGQVIEQVKVNINKSVKAGMDRVTIQLRPENLGRIEVKMELTQDGKVRAFITADVRDTLDMLQRDARGLERALQDAGLRTDSNNLHFALRNESQGQHGQSEQGKSATASNENDDGEAEDRSLEEEEYDRQQAAAARGGVDQLV